MGFLYKISTSYSVKSKLSIFLLLVVLLVILICTTAIIGLNKTNDSLSKLRGSSLNQIFLAMSLGIKTAQISTYATRLTQTNHALQYQAESASLKQEAEKLQILLSEMGNVMQQHNDFKNMAANITILEKKVEVLLIKAHQRHLINTDITTKLHQIILTIVQIRRLDNKYHYIKNSQFFDVLDKIEKLIEATAIEYNYSEKVLDNIKSFVSLLSENEIYRTEIIQLTLLFDDSIHQAKNLSEINLEIKSLIYQTESYIRLIEQDYRNLTSQIILDTKNQSQQTSETISKQSTYIIILSLGVILLTLIFGFYIYSILGKRLSSITSALKKLANGNKSIDVPQRQNHDEIGDLARAFHIFHQNMIKLDYADAQLKEKNEFLESIFFAMRDGFAIFNNENNLISYNQQFIRLLDIPDNKLQSSYSLDSIKNYLTESKATIYNSSQPITLKQLQEISDKLEPLELEYKSSILEWRVSRLSSSGIIILLIDRTKHKKLEIDLAHTQKTRAISHLTGGIAHDFNNLLTIIIGNLDLIDPESLTERQAKRVQRALKAAENSALLTQRLLAYSRKQPLHPKPIDINQLLVDFIDLIKHSVPSTITIHFKPEKNLPLTYIDKNQLETALMNLIVNAKDAIEGVGNITLKTHVLSVKRTNKLEKMLQITISDDGKGMSPDILNKIFEPFFTTKQNGKGSGLGLSMVYGFIRQSGGRILVESTLNIGTTFFLQLPIWNNENKIEPPPLSLSTTPNSKQTILLVEDQKPLQQTLIEQLTLLGYIPTACSSGEEAINYLQDPNHRFHYVLSDIVLSGNITGIDVADRAVILNPAPKVLLMTGYHDFSQQSSCHYPILKKPFKQTELQHILASL